MESFYPIIDIVKSNLSMTANSLNEYFIQLIKSNLEELAGRGVDINLNDAADKVLIADIVAAEYRSKETGESLPRNIEKRIMDRKVRGRCGDVQQQD